MLPTIPSLRKPEYQISNSLRFRSSASAYLSRTFTTPTSNTTWTWSGWVKRGALGVWHSVFNSGSAGNGFSFSPTNNLIFALGNVEVAASTAVFRDPSAYYHLVVRSNGTNIKGFVNNIEVLSYTGTIPAVNSAATHYIFCNGGINNFVDGYLAEVHFVDGQALTPAAFGATSSKTGVWAPRKYTGTYGTNGFYLDFVDNSAATSATIGKDRSGNYNSWTPTNISMVAGSTYDSMTDTPTQYGDAAYYYSGTQYPYNALNFRSGSSSYLSRAFAANSSSTAWTYSGWVKRSQLGVTAFGLLGGSVTNNNQAEIWFNSSDQLVVNWYNVSSQFNLITTQVFNDTTAWYHIVVAFNSTDTTPSNRLKIYINGVQVTSFSTASYPGLNVTPPIYTNVTTHIGRYYDGTSYYGAGYMADINFVDTQTLTPAAFAETINGTWVPKTYTGTYGTNGFYLKFNDNSAATAAALGRDSAGTNNWTPTNLATTDVTSTDITSRRLVNPNYGLQFRSSASTYLSRTPLVTGSQTTWTWSGWIKRGALAGTYGIFGAGTDNATNRTLFWFNSSDQLVYQQGNTNLRTTAAVFRDTSAWGHLVVAIDNGNPTASNRILMYWDGVLLTTTGAGDPGSTFINLVSVSHKIGTRTNPPTTECFDGIIAEVNFIDGQALTPAAFAETDGTGTWVPKAYSGTYGTNGFYLNFADRSAMTPATIGNDASSNSNNWQPNNMAIADAVDYGVKGVRGNYAVLSPIDKYFSDGGISNGNLYMTSSNWNNTRATIGVSSGKWYWETAHTTYNQSYQGIADGVVVFGNNTLGVFATGYNAAYFQTGQKIVNGTTSAYGASLAIGDIVGFALDMDAGTLTCYKNNVSQGVMVSGLSGVIHPACSTANGMTLNANFGQRPFAYTPPTGFKALCTHNLPDPAIVHGHAYMAATTYTGTGVGRNISNFSNNRSFRPDLVWIKSRSNATDHALYDTLRGAQQDLVSNSTAAETTQSTGLTAFREDGFGLSTLTKLNSVGNTYVAWQWKAGDGVVTNTAGSITSQVDAGTTQGVSVVTYTGTGANATVGHGLGVAPKMVIVKGRTTTTENWNVWHSGLGASRVATRLQLNTTVGDISDGSTAWNTVPSSSAFGVGSWIGTNGSSNLYVAYCFAEIAGYSKFGSYTGNGSADGPFVFCNFRPKWVMVKASSTGGTNYDWTVYDSTRMDRNVCLNPLVSNLATAESGFATAYEFDILSNGFKLRNNGAAINASGVTYIFAAFAEVPSKYALAR